VRLAPSDTEAVCREERTRRVRRVISPRFPLVERERVVRLLADCAQLHSPPAFIPAGHARQRRPWTADELAPSRRQQTTTTPPPQVYLSNVLHKRIQLKTIVSYNNRVTQSTTSKKGRRNNTIIRCCTKYPSRHYLTPYPKELSPKFIYNLTSFEVLFFVFRGTSE